MQRTLGPKIIDRDSLQLGAPGGSLNWLTYMEDGVFLIELMFVDGDEL